MQWTTTKVAVEYSNGEPSVTVTFRGSGAGGQRADMRGRAAALFAAKFGPLAERAAAEVTAYRAARASQRDMRKELDRAQLALDRIDLDRRTARAELAGAPLALRLGELSEQEQAARGHFERLRAGVAQYAVDVEAARKAAEAALTGFTKEARAACRAEASPKREKAEAALAGKVGKELAELLFFEDLPRLLSFDAIEAEAVAAALAEPAEADEPTEAATV